MHVSMEIKIESKKNVPRTGDQELLIALRQLKPGKRNNTFALKASDNRSLRLMQAKILNFVRYRISLEDFPSDYKITTQKETDKEGQLYLRIFRIR